MRVERIGLDDALDERAALAVASGNIFATPEFHATWWRFFGEGRELLLHTVRDDDGALAGVLPLYRWRPGVARFLGHGGGDELGPIAREHHVESVAGALREVAPPFVVCEHIRPRWTSALRAHPVLEEATPVLPVASFAGWDEYLASRSANFRGQVRSRTRRLAKEHDVVFRLADEESLDDDLATLFRLHRARWDRPSTFGSREQFHRAFARVALSKGWTRLILLELDGAPAAAWYGFRFAEADSYYQSGRDPSRERDSVGLVLLAHTIECAFADARAEYRFLRGDEPYKFRFTDDPSFVESAIGGALGAPAALALRVSRAGARRLRRSRRTARPAGERRPAA